MADINDSLGRLSRKKHTIAVPVVKLIEKLANEVNSFGFCSEEGNHNIDAAINWAIKYGMYSQAATMAREYILTLVADEFKELNPFENEIDFREFLSSVLSAPENTDEWKGNLKIHCDLAFRLRENEVIKGLTYYYSQLALIRNSLNHGKGVYPIKSVKKLLPFHYQKCLALLESRFK